ncbi:hypothetical protein [Streptomyces sp. ISL-11]|uniref:hypothetical protein n=1 Tax=Streptomyces sp. ISL-11 TaxID=2819174 RepID=UPI001BE9A0A4|nr:hypothetical protein [Streptomyces sp. ISL-11]MBT2383715.1 hypothetical protein [Streptomyces sp. ISL-11]
MRRKTIVSASATAGAAALALGALLAGCGGSDRDGYVATGAAGPGSSRSVDGAVPPKGGVELVPLDGGTTGPSGSASASGSSPAPDPSKTSPPPPPSPSGPPTTSAGNPGHPAARTPGRPGGTADGSTPSAPHRDPAGGNGPSHPSAPSDPSPSASGTRPGRPASITVGTPRRTPGTWPWCEEVTVPFTNTGDRPATAGTVTFGTHVIGPLGTDWATVSSTRPLPAPIDAGRTVEKTWTVCVDVWRIPPGMRIETRDVSAVWS